MNQISAKQVLATIGGILGLIVTLYALDARIDSKIEDKVNDPEFRAALSSTIRPSVIFDSNETILVDLGAMQYIDSIVVAARLRDLRIAPTRIIVKPKNYLPHAPLLSSLDQYNFNIVARRAKGIDWQFDLDLTSYADGKQPPRFRLEVLR